METVIVHGFTFFQIHIKLYRPCSYFPFCWRGKHGAFQNYLSLIILPPLKPPIHQGFFLNPKEILSVCQGGKGVKPRLPANNYYSPQWKPMVISV